MTLDNGQPSIHCLLEWCHNLRSHARPGSPPSIVLFEEIINFIFRTRLSRKFETKFHAMLADKVENLLDFGNDPLSYGIVIKGEAANQDIVIGYPTVCKWAKEVKEWVKDAKVHKRRTACALPSVILIGKIWVVIHEYVAKELIADETVPLDAVINYQTMSEEDSRMIFNKYYSHHFIFQDGTLTLRPSAKNAMLRRDCIPDLDTAPIGDMMGLVPGRQQKKVTDYAKRYFLLHCVDDLDEMEFQRCLWFFLLPGVEYAK